MKRIILSMILVSIVTTGHAKFEVSGFPTIFSDYESFFYSYCGLDKYEEGTWQYDMALDKYRYIYYGNRTYCYDWQILYRYENGKYIKKKCIIEWGDSIVDGISYAKTTIDDKDTLLYRQDGGKIYCRTKNGEELLLINFDLEVGDTFINPLGEKYIIQNKKICNNPIVGSNGTASNEDERPLQLELVAEDGREEIWVEGIGSLKWGILPPYMFLEIGDYDTPEWSSILRVRNVNVGATSEVNEDAYKLIFFPIKDYYEYPEYYNEHKEELGFSFIGDTLLIQGVMKLNNLRSYAECVFDGNVVDVGIHQYINPLLYPTGLAYRYFEAKVPGFKAGTYIVNGQTLVCKGADGIESIQNSKFKIDNNAPVYDLSGRRVVNPKRGVYIQGNKKIIR